LALLRGVFQSSQLGHLLKPVFEEENTKNEAAMGYLNDFLHMMYKPEVDGEFQVTACLNTAVIHEKWENI
jgi:hypothetical protein